MKKYRVFCNDRGGEKYSAVKDVMAISAYAAARKVKPAWRGEKLHAVRWPANARGLQWLDEHVNVPD